MAVIPTVSEGWWDDVQNYTVAAAEVAGKAEEIIDAPFYDLAAVLDIDVTWILGALLSAKVLAIGLTAISQHRRSRR